MKHIESELLQLVQKHKAELSQTAQEYGGVFVSSGEGSVIVYGASNGQIKEIFRTSFVGHSRSDTVDERVLTQDILEQHGIEVISEMDFKIALEEM